jgi:hypothetical protein
VQTYPVRTSHRGNLRPETLEQIAKGVFDAARTDGSTVETSFGALVRLKARADGKALGIEVEMNPKVPDETARETIRRYNVFLEQVTGFNAKERAKRARKSSGGE